MTYDKAYFIAKFEAIPEGMWRTGSYGEGLSHCALGHCGVWSRETPEADALVRLFEPEHDMIGHASSVAASINDGQDNRYQQPTPKQRILAALHDLP